MSADTAGAAASGHIERYDFTHDASIIPRRILTTRRIRRRPVLGGLMHEYERAAEGRRPAVVAEFWNRQVFDAAGEPAQRRGVTAADGLYFLGLRWMYTRASSFLSGVGSEAE